MKGFLRIVYRNAWRHKMTSLVLLVVFILAAFVLFWVFGWGRAMVDSLKDYLRSCYGDIDYQTGFFNREEVEASLSDLGLNEVTIEANIYAMLDSVKISDVINLRELSPGFAERAERFLRPVTGRMPEQINEIIIPEIFHQGTFALGDTLYLSTCTPDGVLNTLPYVIVGKSMNTFALITSESMDLLLNSKQRNFLTVQISPQLSPREQVLSTKQKITALLGEQGIKINKDKTIYDELDRLDYLVTMLPGLKGLIMVVLFPVVGSVVAAILWISSVKRRKEIWTYLALGCRDRTVIALITMELWLVSGAGAILGLMLSLLSAWMVEKLNIWLSFGYTFSLPLWAKYSLLDFTIICLFILLSVSIWLWLPVKRVINDKPFSY